jgi:hypothetical protein
MKKAIALIFFITIYTASFGQSLTVSVPIVTASVGQFIYIPVKLAGAGSSGVPISSANIQITYDTAVLTYDTLINFYTGTPQNQWFFTGHNGLVSANWLEPSLLSLAIPDNTTLYEIKFTYKGGTSPLNFTVNEFTDAAYNLIPTTAVNGAVNPLAVNHQVTFQVDMSMENVSSYGVHLAGSFNNWSYTQTPMTQTSNGIYTATLSIQENMSYQYRYTNGTSASGLETVPASCGVMNGGGTYDRQITVPNHDTTYQPVCFSMCSHCPYTYPVTFRVDMQHETVSPNGIHIAGTFNNWNYTQTQLISAGGTVYEAMVPMEEESYIEYRFANGNNASQSENVPAACAISGNRYFTVPSHDTTLNAVCYDSCVACGTAMNYSQVTFRVDLRAQPSISADGVHIAGTFQGWNPGSTPLVTSGDSIYTYSDSLLAGTSVQYKYVNGNVSAGYEVVPFACSSNGNRSLLVPVNDTVLNLVCFSECDTCLLTGISEFSAEEFTLFQNFPNPCRDLTHIGYKIGRNGHLAIRVFNSMGLPVATLYDDPCAPGSYTMPFSVALLTHGFYYYQMIFTSGNATFLTSKKMIVQ